MLFAAAKPRSSLPKLLPLGRALSGTRFTIDLKGVSALYWSTF